MRRNSIFLVLILTLSLGVQAMAADYPSRPINLIVPWGAGGGADLLGRTISTLLEKELKVNMPVVNIPGAIAGVGLAQLKAAKKDGYTISVITADSVGAESQGKLAMRMDEFHLLARMQLAPSYLLVPYDSPFKTFDELMKYAKEKPNQLKVAVTGGGSPDDLTVKFLADKGIKMTSVPYPKPGERYASVLGKHNEILYEQAGDVFQFIEAKQMRPLVIFFPKRVAAFPEVPAIKEFGYEIYLPQYRGVLINQGVDKDRVDVLVKALKKTYEHPDYQKFLKQQYCTPDSYMGSEEFTAFVQEDLKSYKQLQ